MSKKTFLIEIGTEELPPKILRGLAENFALRVTNELNNAELKFDEIKWFATPRRLALKVTNIAAFQPSHKIKKHGPRLDQAFDIQGNLSKATKNWTRNCNITVDQAGFIHTDKGERLVHYNYTKGKKAEDLLPKIIIISLKKLSVPKLMHWGISNVYFVRPVHTITLLLDSIVIPANILGVTSNRMIHGHRFMGESKFIINNADQYPQILLDRGKVIADYEIRKAKIKADIEEITHKIGGNADMKDDLLEEVTSLIEWPVVLTAKFEEKFLSIPVEVIVHIMRRDQKYFPVYSKEGKLLPTFIFVTNIESKDPNQIIFGNEKVLHSRLSDAEYFFKVDCKKRLEDNLSSLQTIIFQQQLGTLRDKTDRITKLSGWIAQEIGTDVEHTMRAGLLSKCDLATSMVFEFPDIQGIIGMHYALRDGEAEDVAVAIKEHYKPRFADDDLPSNLIACAVAIADKIDSLVGILSTGYYPKGDKDPFALRRTALGLLRIIVQKNLNLDLKILIKKSMQMYGNNLNNVNTENNVIDFIFHRFLAWYRKHYAIDTIQAVLALRPTRPIDFDARIKAISRFRVMEKATLVVTANKRISNILAKSSETLNDIVHKHFLKELPEINLSKDLVLLHKKLQPYFINGSYQEALIELTSLSEKINEFFKEVIVNTEDKNVRINRLTLLSKLRDLFLQIADISLLKQ